MSDHVIADECATHDRHEGIVVGIELQRLYGSEYLQPSITLLHDGYLTDGFKPADLRHKPFTFADAARQAEWERQRKERGE
jgi:hypothetical protein